MLNRVSLNTIGLNRIGLNRIGKPSRGSSDRPYIDPEVLASLKAVCICYGKSNDDPDRAIVKNLVDPDNPFVISNAAFKLNSGFGLYAADFLDWTSSKDVQKTSFEVKITSSNYKENWVAYKAPNTTFKAMKVRISGIPDGGALQFFRTTADGGGIKMVNGINEIPTFTNTVAAGFYIDIPLGFDWSNLVIEQIPSFEGAFVTDGIDDLITSTKTVQEMLGGSNEITVVSLITHISGTGKYNIIGDGGIQVSDYSGQTFMAGTSSSGEKIVELGDKEKLQAVQYTTFDSKLTIGLENSSYAYYGTFVFNKENVPVDWIHQVIAYFNLDRTLNPDILCNTIKQGITNENHAEFGDKLIDYSGNGRDIQLNNIAWKGDSGIGKYETELSNTSIWTKGKETTSSPFSSSYNGLSGWIIFANTSLTNSADMPSFKIQVKGLLEGQELIYRYYDSNGQSNVYSITKDGEYTLPSDVRTAKPQTSNTSGFQVVKNETNIITITQIPSHAGALCLDGVNDFGKVTGMPIYKDYTFIIEREFLNETFPNQVCLVSKSKVASEIENGGAFIVDNISVNSIINPYSFYKTTSLPGLNTFDRQIVFQSKYKYLDKDIAAGTATDSDTLWLGTFRDNDSRFFNGAIYSLMSFPYSMSKFLIERQLKKHKLGTLYPNMVEFRPVIKKDDRIKSIKYYIDGKTANIGQYYPIGTGLGIAVETVQPYMVKSLKVNGVNTIPNADYKGFNARLDSKSPQKITMDIQVDTNLIQWNPIITSTVELTTAPTFAIRGTSTLLKPGDWIPKNSEIWVIVTMNNLIDELRKFSFNGTFINIPSSSYNPDTGKYGFPFVIDNESTQNINLTIDEYIRFEDIVQPYPVLLRFNDENGNEVSWGGKFRVGSTITRIGSAADSNLLPNIYNIFGLLLNDNQVTSSKVIVEKTMVFKAKSAYIFDNNEPNCILSPRLLRIPNSSYKILGYIPDISGHGNHGVIHNSAYGEGSGVNKDGSYQFDGVDDHITIPTVTGGGKQVLMKVNNNTINSMLYDQRSSGASPNSLYDDFAIYCTNSADNNQIAYQSRLVGNTYIDGILNTNITCEDLLGVLHNITITCDIVAPNNGVVPNIGRGGVLKDLYSKVALYDFMLFDSISTDDKIKELNEYVGIEAKVELPPYYWDNYGKTNLDEDKNYTANLGTVKDVIEVSQPAIFAENWYDGNPEPVLFSPIINQTDYSIEVKANKMDNNFTMMLDVECDTPLPAFKAKFSMVGTAISVNLKYYINGGSKIIDVFKSGGSTEPVILDIPASERSFIYGTNTDNYPNILIEVLPADNGTRYGLTNTNFAYDKMSGYGGYSLGRFDKSWSSSSSNNTSVIVVSRNLYDITLKKLGGNSDWEFNNTELKVISNPVSVKFKSNKNIRVTCDYHYYPVGGNSEGVPLGITSKDLIANKDAIITISPISQENIDKYNIDVNRGYYLIYFQLSSTLAVNEEVTIEMLPLYPNGLVYDGVTDYSENANIPALTDYTYIFKRDILGFNPRSVSMHKGTSTNAGRAFTSDYDYGETNEVLAYSFGSSIATPNATSKKIIYGTKTSVDGQPITPGSNIDDAGLFIGKWYDDFFKKMVFYKLILYPKTIPLLQINFLKNLMERDEIIDLNNPIFIQE